MKILCLDGGGAKGVYSLGILREIERLAGKPLSSCFDSIYGTSTGSIIAAALALGMSADEIWHFYRKDVPGIMSRFRAQKRASELRAVLGSVFGDRGFDRLKTQLGVVSTHIEDK